MDILNLQKSMESKFILSKFALIFFQKKNPSSFSTDLLQLYVLDLDFLLITQMLNVLCFLNLSTSFDRRLGKLLS